MSFKYCSKLSRMTIKCTRRAMTTSARSTLTSYFCRIHAHSFINLIQSLRKF